MSYKVSFSLYATNVTLYADVFFADVMVAFCQLGLLKKW